MLKYSSLNNIYCRSQPVPAKLIQDINGFAEKVFLRQIYPFVKSVFLGKEPGFNYLLLYNIPIDFNELDNIYGKKNKFGVKTYNLEIAVNCELTIVESRKYTMSGGFDIDENDIELDIGMDFESIFDDFFKEKGVLKYYDDFYRKITRDIVQVIYHEIIHFIRYSYEFDRNHYRIHNDRKYFGELKKIFHDYEPKEIEPILSSIQLLVDMLNGYLKEETKNPFIIEQIKRSITKNIERYKHPRERLLNLFKGKGISESEMNETINYTLKRMYETVMMIEDNEFKYELLNKLRS